MLNLRCAVAILAVTAMSSLTLAQTSQPASQPADEAATEQVPAATTGATPLLAGPKVIEANEGIRGVSPRGDVRRVEIQPRRWFSMLRELDLTRNQQRFAMAEIRAYQQEQADFAETHQSELQSLERDIRRLRQGDMDINPANLQRVAELRDARPTPDKTQLAIWRELTIAQQERMRELIQDARRQLRDRERRQRDRRRNGSDRTNS